MGRCAVFDNAAGGYVRGEGLVAFVLTKESIAKNQDEQILAYIIKSGANNDGKCMSIQAPNGDAQENLLKSVLTKSKVSSSDITMMECHGTGTLLGDVTEFNAIQRAFFTSSTPVRSAPLLLGSVKTNIGKRYIYNIIYIYIYIYIFTYFWS